MMAYKIIKMPAPPARATYVRWVLENGHVPGVLSGAELRGKAKRFGASYYRSRMVAEQHAAEHGDVRAELVYVPDYQRRCRVWVGGDNEFVRIVLE